MARVIDYTKIERVQQATMKLIVEKGFGGASIAMISRKAKVAEGYLYRFYNSKNDLVSDILYQEIKELVTFIKELLAKSSSITEIVKVTINHIFELGKNNPTSIRFLYVLLHDYNFQINQEQQQTIYMLFEELTNINTKEMGKKSFTKEQLFTMIVMYPIQYINYRFKGYFQKDSWNKNDITNVINFSLNALKQ